MIRSTVECIRGSSGEINPTNGSNRFAASRAVSSYDCVKAPSDRIISPLQNFGTNLLADKTPPWKISLQVQLLSCSNCPIKRDPAHDFRIQEMTWTATNFPDAAIRLMPVCTHVLYKGTHHFPQRAIQFFTTSFKTSLAPKEMDTIKHFSENVQLFLIGRTVPYSYRARITISTEMRQFSLVQIRAHLEYRT